MNISTKNFSITQDENKELSFWVNGELKAKAFDHYTMLNIINSFSTEENENELDDVYFALSTREQAFRGVVELYAHATVNKLKYTDSLDASITSIFREKGYSSKQADRWIKSFFDNNKDMFREFLIWEIKKDQFEPFLPK